METKTQSSTPTTTTFKSYLQLRASPPPPAPSPVPPPAPVPIPIPPPPPATTTLQDEYLSFPVCDTPETTTVTPWLSTNAAIIIALTITIAVTVEIVFKFFILRRKKREYEKYIDERMKTLNSAEDEVYWSIKRRRLGL